MELMMLENETNASKATKNRLTCLRVLNELPKSLDGAFGSKYFSRLNSEIIRIEIAKNIPEYHVPMYLA